MKITEQKNLHSDSYQDRKTNKNLCIEKFTESPGKKLNHFLKKQRFLADII
jgi:hypothetical protein